MKQQILGFALLFVGHYGMANTLKLDGRSLTLKQVEAVSQADSPKVELSSKALLRMNRSYKLLVEATCENISMYGVNRGVGGNSGQDVFQDSILKPENRKLSEEYNAKDLRATSAALGEDLPSGTVRAMMLLRINDMLAGTSGARPELAQAYANLLNAQITPAVPGVGSIGEADIAIMSHIGLTLMGEGDAYYKGSKVTAAEALKAAGLKPFTPFAVEHLVIMSTNAYSEALAVRAIVKGRQLLHAMAKVYAMSLEGAESSVSHILPVTLEDRFASSPGTLGVANEILTYLEGSYVLDVNAQLSLSYIDQPNFLGSLWDTLDRLEATLVKDLNSGKNQPGFFVSDRPHKATRGLGKENWIQGGVCENVRGYTLDNGGYEPFHWSVQLDLLKSNLNMIAIGVAQRIRLLGDSDATGLGSFLSPGQGVLAYSASQKVVDTLRGEIQSKTLSRISTGLTMAGGGEDVASFAPQSALDVLDMEDNLAALIGLELIHAAQAVDLRLIKNQGLQLGSGTHQLRKSFRAIVPFLDKDRPLTPDFRAAKQFVLEL